MDTVLLFGLPGGFEWLIFLCILGFPFLLMILALINILQSEFVSETNKIIWVLIVLILPFFGSVLYFILSGNQKKIRK